MAQEILGTPSVAKVVIKPAKQQAIENDAKEAGDKPTLAADSLKVSGPATKPEKVSPETPATVPGENIRNTVSAASTVLGPVVTAKQGVGLLADTTFKLPLLNSLSNFAVKAAHSLGQFKIFSNPLVTSGLRTTSRVLPFVGAGLLAFDGFATIKTFTNPESSGMRKALTAGRFAFNAIATGISFIPGAGFVYSLIPGMVGNVFEIALAKYNADAGKK